MALPYDDATLEVLRARAKVALRKRLRAVRASLPEAARAERSRQIGQRVCALDVWQRAGVVAVFRSMEHEVDTAWLIADARARGAVVALPCVLDDHDTLVFRVAWHGERAYALQYSAMGIEEPDASAPTLDPAEIDVVVVPALALDASGQRLGYGRGWYDRTLPRCTRATTLAVAFDFQLLAEIPCGSHDVPVHWIVTDQRTLHAAVQIAASTDGDP
jgi:5-formyltetrahydrofolate cyclo-ligase